MRSQKFLIWIIAILILCSTAYATLLDGLAVYYTFDNADSNNTHAFDKQNLTNCTLKGNTVRGADGKLGEAFYYDGTGDGCDTTIPLNQLNSTANWTICGWVNISTNTADWDGFWGNIDGANHGMGAGMGEADDRYRNIWTDTGISAVLKGYQAVCQRRWSNTTTELFVNASLINSHADAYITSTGYLIVGSLYILSKSTIHQINGTIDEWGFWNRSLSNAELSSLFNAGAGLPYASFGGAGTVSNFSVTATDEWNSSSLNISVWVDGSFYYTNYTVMTDILQNSTTTHNVTIGASGYFNRTYYDLNVSSNLAGQLHQAEICFNATQKVSEAGVPIDNITIDSTTHPSCFNLSAGTYNVMAQKSGWFNQNQSVTITPLKNDTLTVQNLSYANLTIYAIDGTTNQSLSGYNLSIGSLNHSWTGETAGSVTNYSFYLINGTYNVNISMPGYAVTTSQANVSVSGHTNYTFVLYKSNSVTITIRDEITNNIITENVTVRWSDNTTTWENVTSTGNLFVYNITPGNYTLMFYSTNYSTRTYSIVVGPSSTQFLTAYMISSTYSTIFTIKDIDTGSILDGVAITMYKLINSTWTTVESKVSDISGKAQFYYDPIANYRFYLSYTGYQDYIFFLNPILFSTYDVYMTKESVLNYSVDFDDISFIYSPTMFNNNENTTLNFLISSPSGLLTDYGIKVTYPGGNDTDSGVNAIGEQMDVAVNITNATAYDYVVLEFNYTTSLSGTRTYTFNLPISMNVTGGTWLTNKDKTYGLGIFERMLIATIIILFIVGIATMVGQALPGVALGLFVYGFLVFIGFVPLWAILPSMLIGVLFLIWKSGGY